jgi:hypothetical protein
MTERIIIIMDIREWIISNAGYKAVSNWNYEDYDNETEDKYWHTLVFQCGRGDKDRIRILEDLKDIQPIELAFNDHAISLEVPIYDLARIPRLTKARYIIKNKLRPYRRASRHRDTLEAQI